MNFEELFDVNQYTEKAMPLCTAICRMLDDKVFYSLSDEERESRQRYSDFRDEVGCYDDVGNLRRKAD